MLTLLSFTKQLQQQAKSANHRQVLRLRGELSWCYQQACLLIKQLELSYLWCGSCPDAILATPYKLILGQETSLLIINAHDQFDANSFAASEGSLRGGGLLILLTPENYQIDDLFYQYINNQLAKHEVATIQKDLPIPLIEKKQVTIQAHTKLNLLEQKTAIDAIIKTVSGHRRRPLVLTANRGRGKSAALGIASAQLLNSGLTTILVCAPNKQATATLFKHASLLSTGKSEHQFVIQKDKQSITFIAPDTLLAEHPKCDLLIIDEAAALPVSTLETIAKHYSRLVFATTQQGYEGSGRGFALRFQKRLSEISPQWRHLHLKQPIRWANNDPLESFTLNSLCLTQSFDNPSYNINADLQFEKLNRIQLINNHSLLQDVFSLLVLAHYQTKPSDLEKLLNEQSLHIFIIKQNQQLLGVALINEEGGIEPKICEQIWQGTRRLQGNLVAQSLTFHSAFKNAAVSRFARIQRIAIHPAIQKQGLGKEFITHLMNWARTAKFDHLCASFSATPDLLSFWQQLNFTTLRIGLSKDNSSGTHSLIVNYPLSAKGKDLHANIQQQFQAQLSIQLTRHLQDLDAELILNLLQEFKTSKVNGNQIDSYCEGNLPYEFAEPCLIELLLKSNLKNLGKMQQCLTIQKVLQNNSWVAVCKKQHLTGKKQAQSILKSAIRQLLKEENHAPR